MVSNYGNVALNNVVLTDSLDGLGNKATLGILAPGETVTIDSLYGVTEEDARAGVVKTSVTGEAACSVPGISTVSAASGEVSVRAGVEEIPSMPTPLAQATPHGLDIPWVPLLAATTGAALLLLLLILLRRRCTEEKQ